MKPHQTPRHHGMIGPGATGRRAIAASVTEAKEAERARAEKALPIVERLGARGGQGGGGFALLADPAVREQVQNPAKEMNSPKFKNRYGGLVDAHKEARPRKRHEPAWPKFNITMMEIGKDSPPLSFRSLCKRTDPRAGRDPAIGRR